MGIGALRRHRMLKAQAALERGDEGLARVWTAKQQQTPGTALPGDFPHKERLEAAGYTTLEDLTDFSDRELYARKFKKAEVAQIRAALEAQGA